MWPSVWSLPGPQSWIHCNRTGRKCRQKLCIGTIKWFTSFPNDPIHCVPKVFTILFCAEAYLACCQRVHYLLFVLFLGSEVFFYNETFFLITSCLLKPSSLVLQGFLFESFFENRGIAPIQAVCICAIFANYFRAAYGWRPSTAKCGRTQPYLIPCGIDPQIWNECTKHFIPH